MSAIGEAWSYLTTASNWTGDDGILALTWNHLRLSAFATITAAVVAVPGGVLVGHRRRGGALAASLVNIGRALPSFAVLVLAFGIFSQWGKGLTIWPTYVALVLLAIPPMFTNTLTGVREVPPDVREAATGMGMRARQLLWRVETPIALPLIVTGLRVSAVQVVATATLGAWVGYQCLGTLIYEGFAQQNDGKILTGAVLVAILTIVVDAAFSVLERAVTPWTRPQEGRAARDAAQGLEPERPAPATG